MDNNKILMIALVGSILASVLLFPLFLQVTPWVHPANMFAMVFTVMTMVLMHAISFFITFMVAGSMRINIGQLTPIILGLPAAVVVNCVTIASLAGLGAISTSAGVFGLLGAAVILATLTYTALFGSFFAIARTITFVDEHLYCLKKWWKEKSSKK